MRILLITHNFPPLNQVGSLRMYHWAKYWAREGNDVFVITTKKYNFDGPLDLDIQRLNRVVINEIPYLPFWCKGAHKISMNYISSNGSEKSVLNINLLKEYNRKCRIYFCFGSLGDIHDFWIRPATKASLNLIQNRPFDIIVSSYGPPSPHLVAAKIKKFHYKIPWIADYRDLWTFNCVMKSKGPFKWIEKWIELSSVGKYADAITTVSEPLANNLHARFNKKTIVIENGFDPEEFESSDYKNLHLIDKNVCKIVYAGTIYPGYRDPTPLFNTILSLHKYGLLDPKKFQILFYGERSAYIENLIKLMRVEEWVKIIGPISRRNMLNVLSNSSALLFLDWCDTNERGIITGKLFEYMASKRPIISIGKTINTEANKIIKNTGIGIACGNDEEKIKEFILDLINNDGNWTGYCPNLDKICYYSRKNQAKRLLNYFETLIRESK